MSKFKIQCIEAKIWEGVNKFFYHPLYHCLFQALLTTDLRTANVIATSEAVECLTLDRE